MPALSASVDGLLRGRDAQAIRVRAARMNEAARRTVQANNAMRERIGVSRDRALS